MSGGTALMLMMKAGVLRPSRLVNLRRLGLDQIKLGALDELITGLAVPAMGSRRAVYLKCTTRSADDWPALGVAVVLDGEKTSIVVSAATDKPTRLASVEAAEALRIESDLHGSAAYKKHLIGVYLRRAIHEARNASR